MTSTAQPMLDRCKAHLRRHLQQAFESLEGASFQRDDMPERVGMARACVKLAIDEFENCERLSEYPKGT